MPSPRFALVGAAGFVAPRHLAAIKAVEDYCARIPGYRARHRVRPGITGLAQIQGDNLTDAEDKLRYDLAYMYNYSSWLDLVIMLETIRVVFGRKGS